MKNLERFIIYILLAIFALNPLLNLDSVRAQSPPSEGTFTKISIVDENGKSRIVLKTVQGAPHPVGSERE